MKSQLPNGWKKQGLAVTRDSTSRMEGVKPNSCKVDTLTNNIDINNVQTVQVLTLNVFLNYYNDYEMGLRLFNEWVGLI